MPAGMMDRELELEAAAGFLGGLQDGWGVLAFAGEPGIGKSTIWQETVGPARASSFVVLCARPGQAETGLAFAGLAFAGLADLLEPVADEVLPGLPSPQQRALRVALLREDPGSRPVDQRAVSAAAGAAFHALAGRQPLVIAVDDLQWLDRPSARVLEFALRRLADAPVGVPASHRVGRGVRLRWPWNWPRRRNGSGGSSWDRSASLDCTGCWRTGWAARSPGGWWPASGRRPAATRSSRLNWPVRCRMMRRRTWPRCRCRTGCSS
jgi:hypothetical protein